jgi:hypothetical protein
VGFDGGLMFRLSFFEGRRDKVAEKSIGVTGSSRETGYFCHPLFFFSISQNCHQHSAPLNSTRPLNHNPPIASFHHNLSITTLTSFRGELLFLDIMDSVKLTPREMFDACVPIIGYMTSLVLAYAIIYYEAVYYDFRLVVFSVLLLCAASFHSFIPSRSRTIIAVYGFLLISSLFSINVYNDFDLMGICQYQIPSLLFNHTDMGPIKPALEIFAFSCDIYSKVSAQNTSTEMPAIPDYVQKSELLKLQLRFLDSVWFKLLEEGADKSTKKVLDDIGSVLLGGDFSDVSALHEAFFHGAKRADQTSPSKGPTDSHPNTKDL